MQLLRFILSSIITTILLVTSSYALKHETEFFSQPNPSNYRDYTLSLKVSNLAPSIGKPVVFKAKISPYLDESKIAYQFLINGEPIAEAGMHKVHIFQKSGVYNISAVATLGRSHLLNSATTRIHVSEAWLPPIAAITPEVVTVKTGETAVFKSTSNTDPKSRQWLYWRISSGHRDNRATFSINTSRLKEGKYPITLLLRDDHKKESTAHATLVINNTNSQAITPTSQTVEKNNQHDQDDLATQDKTANTKNTSTNTSTLIDLTFHASHTHRFTGFPIVFWVQNTQIGANTRLQLDTGDGELSSWGRRVRYTHLYNNFGTYHAQLLVKTSPNATTSTAQKTLTVYIWPLWLPILIIGVILLLALVWLFKRRKQQLPTTEKSPVTYQHHTDEGYQQITIHEESEQKTASFNINQQVDTGTQTLKPSKGE
jgi:hypothetical protein